MKHLLKVAGLVCASLAVLAGGSPVNATTNLLANPGFETGGGSYTGFFTFGSGVQLSLPTTDNIANTGTAAAKVFGGFTGCPNSPVFNVGGFGQAFTPVVGQMYEFGGFSYVSAADPMLGTTTCTKNRAVAKVVFFDATSGGNEIASDEVVIGDGNTPTNAWVPFHVAATAPAAARRVEALILFLQPGCDAGSVFIDDLALTATTPSAEPNVLTNPGFATGLTGWSTFGNVFTDARAFTLRSSPGSAKLFSTFVAGSPSGLFQTVATTPGTPWRLQVWARNTCQETPVTDTNDNYVLARISFRDAGNTEIGSNDVVVADKTSPLGPYVLKSVEAVAPTGTVSVQPYILFISPSLLGGAIWIDDVNFHAMNAADAPVSAQTRTLELSAPVPNPMRSSARVAFSLPQQDQVDVGIYDVAGRRMATLYLGSLAAGPHAMTWDGQTASGLAAANGVYRVVVRTSAGHVARSIVLSR